MSDQKNQHHNPSRFWTGFSLGAVVGVAGVYFFGTNSGRKNLKKALDLTENLEETIEKVMGGVGEEYIEGLAGSEPMEEDRPAEQGKIVEEKESLLQVLLRTAALYVKNSKQNQAQSKAKSDTTVH